MMLVTLCPSYKYDNKGGKMLPCSRVNPLQWAHTGGAVASKDKSSPDESGNAKMQGWRICVFSMGMIG